MHAILFVRSVDRFVLEAPRCTARRRYLFLFPHIVRFHHIVGTSRQREIELDAKIEFVEENSTCVGSAKDRRTTLRFRHFSTGTFTAKYTYNT